MDLNTKVSFRIRGSFLRTEVLILHVLNNSVCDISPPICWRICKTSCCRRVTLFAKLFNFSFRQQITIHQTTKVNELQSVQNGVIKSWVGPLTQLGTILLVSQKCSKLLKSDLHIFKTNVKTVLLTRPYDPTQSCLNR